MKQGVRPWACGPEDIKAPTPRQLHSRGAHLSEISHASSRSGPQYTPPSAAAFKASSAACVLPVR